MKKMYIDTICQRCALAEECTQVVGMNGTTHWCTPLHKWEIKEYDGYAIVPKTPDQCNAYEPKGELET